MSLNKVTQLQEQAQELRRPCRSSRAGLISDDYILLDVAQRAMADIGEDLGEAAPLLCFLFKCCRIGSC